MNGIPKTPKAAAMSHRHSSFSGQPPLHLLSKPYGSPFQKSLKGNYYCPHVRKMRVLRLNFNSTIYWIWILFKSWFPHLSNRESLLHRVVPKRNQVMKTKFLVHGRWSANVTSFSSAYSFSFLHLYASPNSLPSRRMRKTSKIWVTVKLYSANSHSLFTWENI